MTSVSPVPFSILPTEVQCLVYTYLSAEDARALSTTCRSLRNTYNSENVQKALFARHFPQFHYQETVPASEQYARAIAQVHRLGLTCLDTITCNDVFRLTISDDGKKALSITNEITTDPSLKFWSIENDEVKFHSSTSIPDQRSMTFLAADCKRNNVVFGAGGTFNIWNCENDIQLSQEYINPPIITSIALNPQGTIAVMGFSNGVLDFLDLTDPQATSFCTALEHLEDIVCIVFRSDGQKVMSLCRTNFLIFWTITGKIATLEKKFFIAQGARSAVMVPNESRIVFSVENHLKVYNFAALEPSYIRTLKQHSMPVTCLASDLATRRVFSGSRDTTVNIWQINKENAFLLQTINGHKAALACLAITPDGSLLLAGDLGDTIKMWRLNSLPHELLRRALKKYQSKEKDPLDELPEFAKKTIYQILYKKLYSHEDEKIISQLPKEEMLEWGNTAFQVTKLYPQEKKEVLQAYKDCLKFPRCFVESPSAESIDSFDEK